MPLDLSFFKSGSSLIRDKQDRLQRSAAATANARMEVGMLEKKRAELDDTEQRIHSLEKRHSINSEEISRRQRQISALDEEARRLRDKMSKAEEDAKKAEEAREKQGMPPVPQRPAVPSAVSEYERKLKHIDQLRRIQSSEIQTLDDQNRAIDIHIENAKV